MTSFNLTTPSPTHKLTQEAFKRTQEPLYTGKVLAGAVYDNAPIFNPFSAAKPFIILIKRQTGEVRLNKVIRTLIRSINYN